MSKRNKHEIIIVGGDHHNGLGMARIFGIHGIRVHACVICDCKKSFLQASRYVASCHVFPNERKAFDFILSFFRSKETYFIIPYSDGAALELDSRLNQFTDFFVPSICKKQGEIAKMMHKTEQYNFAKNAHIKMANTLVIDFNDNQFSFTGEELYPCIIKPEISAGGDKRDITICKNKNEFESAYNNYKAKGYKKALVQEYLKIDYEIDVFGCTLRQEPYICLVPTKTIRMWPPQGGTNSFSKIITDVNIIRDCKKIIQKLLDSGFYGLYDIELFVVDNELILNEINYRNSGDVYMGINQGYFYPYAWFLDNIGKNIEISEYPARDDYTMTECADLRNVIIGQVGLFKWIKEYASCKDYALKFKGDMKPAYNRYAYYIKQFLRGKQL